ncbi:MAG: hypothetical protein H6737_04030 [Alphaproteobacteria bacterium]|nr:hypothetical protein [Alphaproteobacteria bacterium]
MTVDAATAALARGDRRGAIDALIAAWRAHPSAALGDAIDRLSALDRVVPLGRSALAEARRTASMPAEHLQGRLRMHLPQLQHKAATAILEAQVERPRDPRWTPLLLQWLDAPPFLSGREFWQAVLQLAAHTADPRLNPRLARGLDSMPWELHGFISQRVWSFAQAESASWPDPAPIDLSALEPAIAAAERAHAAQDALRAELFERIARDPDDREALAVFADLLVSDDDPRGELVSIALSGQTGREAKRRVRELEKEHGLSWMGDLAPHVLQSGLAFHHGVPTGARVVFKQARQVPSALGDPAWRLFRELELDTTVSWEHGRPTPWQEVLDVARNVEVVRWAEDARTLGEILFGERVCNVREIHGRAAGYAAAWVPQALREGVFRLPRLERLVLPPMAVRTVLEALRRGMTVQRVELVHRPSIALAEARKYGQTGPGPSIAEAESAFRRLKNRVPSVRVEAGWYDAVEAVFET